MQRSLAAVLAADVAGYSELVGNNSEEALTALKRVRSEVFGPAVASRKGRIVKNMGDGWLVLFSAASDATTCALQIQDLLSAELYDGDAKIMLRLGVHLGDVFQDDDDVFGDGVNIAARLEELASPGSIVISDAVFGSLDGTLRPSFSDAGEQSLKNISKPVRIWTRGTLPVPSNQETNKSDRPCLVVRPIATWGDKTELTELANAITGDLLTYFDATHWLRLATGSDTRDSYCLTARLRAQDTRIRLETRIIGPAGQQIWSSKHDGSTHDLFDFQDLAAEEVVSQTLAVLLDEERRKLDKLDVEKMSANQCELRGQLAFERLDPDACASALSYASKAIDKDPEAPHALALALVSYLSASFMGYRDVNRTFGDEVRRWCQLAEPIADENAQLGLALGVTKYSKTKNQAELRVIVERALRQSSSDLVTLALGGWAYIWVGDYSIAHECLAKAWKLGRKSPWTLAIAGGLAMASLLKGDDENAVLYAQNGISVSSDYAALHRILAAAQANMGQFSQARLALDAALRLDGEDTITTLVARNVFSDLADGNRYIEGLRLAGMPE